MTADEDLAKKLDHLIEVMNHVRWHARRIDIALTFLLFLGSLALGEAYLGRELGWLPALIFFAFTLNWRDWKARRDLIRHRPSDGG